VLGKQAYDEWHASEDLSHGQSMQISGRASVSDIKQNFEKTEPHFVVSS